MFSTRFRISVFFAVALSLACVPTSAHNIGRYFFVAGSSATPVPHPTFTAGAVIAGGFFGHAPYTPEDKPLVQEQNTEIIECGAIGCTPSPTDGGMHRRVGMLLWYTSPTYWQQPKNQSAFYAWCTTGCPYPTDVRAINSKAYGRAPFLSWSATQIYVPPSYPTYPVQGVRQSILSFVPASVAQSLGFPSPPPSCPAVNGNPNQGCYEVWDPYLSSMAAGLRAYGAAVYLRPWHEVFSNCLVSYVLAHGACANGDSSTFFPLYDPNTCGTWPVNSSCPNITVQREADIYAAAWQYVYYEVVHVYGATNVAWMQSFTGSNTNAQTLATAMETCWVAGYQDAAGHTMSCDYLQGQTTVYDVDTMDDDAYDFGGVSSAFSTFNGFYNAMNGYHLPMMWVESGAPNSTVVTSYAPCALYTPGADTQSVWFPWLVANMQTTWPNLVGFSHFESWSAAPPATTSPSPVPAACGKDWNFDAGTAGLNRYYTLMGNSYFSKLAQGTPAPTSTPWP